MRPKQGLRNKEKEKRFFLGRNFGAKGNRAPIARPRNVLKIVGRGLGRGTETEENLEGESTQFEMGGLSCGEGSSGLNHVVLHQSWSNAVK